MLTARDVPMLGVAIKTGVSHLLPAAKCHLADDHRGRVEGVLIT